MSAKVKFSIIALALTASAVAGWYVSRGAKLPATTARDVRTQRSVASLPDGAIRFAPKENYRYTYQFERTVLVRWTGVQAGEPLKVYYHGDFTLDVLRSDASGFEAVITHRLAESPKAASPRMHMRLRLNSSDSRLELFASEQKTDDAREQVSILKDLVANFIFQTDVDTVGRYDARVAVVKSGSDAVIVEKEKLRYIETATAAPQILRSSHLLDWNRNLAFPQEIRGSEVTQMGQHGTTLSSESGYRIRFVAMQAGNEISKTALAGLSKPQPMAFSPADKMQEHPDYASLNWSDVSSELADLETMNAKNQLRIFGDLVRLLRKEPDRLGDVLALLSKNVISEGAHSALFKMVIGALATVGTPEAQVAIVNVYRDPACPVSGKGAILAALTTTQAQIASPTRDFLAAAMKSESDNDLSRGAAYALGASLQNGSTDSTTAQALQLIRDTWNSQSTQKSITERLSVLDAIGNSGRAEFLPELRGVITGNDSSIIRAKAVYALRFVSGDQASQLLISSLGDADLNVREAAILAMKTTWRETFRGPLENCSAHETVRYLRQSCESALASAD